MVATEQARGATGKVSRAGQNLLAAAVALLVVLTPTLTVADDLNADINRLKAEVADLAGELYALEESILHPADTQVAVFLTLARKDVLELDSIELFVNDTPVSSHLYTDRERQSLQQGGVQQLYLGNVPHGEHELRAVLTARTGNDRYIRREAEHRFQKRPGESRIKLSLDARAPDYEPRFLFSEWK